ncbi:MAG: 16S rRNA (guanine(527)-N(7))-methyltransferase RsmG [Alphaproteobacteria bacterium]
MTGPAPGNGNNLAASTIWTAATIAQHYNVSHETLARLEIYVALLLRWQQTINLIGPGTKGDVWGRHIADALQFVAAAPQTAKIWVDLGTGAGLPGMVLGIALLQRPGFHMHLIEANQRKCAFLRVVAQNTGAPVTIHNRRIEDFDAGPETPRADVITARALAPLTKLLPLAMPFVWKNTVMLFAKGQDVEGELTEAAISWRIQVDRIPSRVDRQGTILRIKEAIHHGQTSQ